jgi:Ca-activated chloride channel family protein
MIAALATWSFDLAEVVWARGPFWPLAVATPLVVFVVARLAARVRGRELARWLAELRGDDAGRREVRFGGGTSAWLRDGFGALAVAAGAIALLQPAWGPARFRPAAAPRGVVVCLDVSRSMEARDVLPTRLDRARRTIGDLVEGAQRAGVETRFALVVFAGSAHLAVPWTRDGNSFRRLVEGAAPADTRRGGTDLGSALALARVQIERHDGDALVVVVTDGEHLGDDERAREQARALGTPLLAIGFGSRAGSRVVLEDAAGGESFLQARDGSEVLSSLDVDGLERLVAAAGGGAFVDGARVSAGALASAVERLVRTGVGRGDASGNGIASTRAARLDALEPRFGIPAAFAVSFGLLALFLRGLGRRRAHRHAAGERGASGTASAVIGVGSSGRNSP